MDGMGYEVDLSPDGNTLVPTVIKSSPKGERAYDLFSRLLEDRIILINESVTDTLAAVVSAELLLLESVDPDKDIHIYINSPGGSVTAGMAIYDTMQLVSCDVSTTCLGMAASMGSVLLAAGAKGKRFALPHARVMIHQPHAGIGGGTQITDMEIRLALFKDMKQELYEIYTLHCGRSVEEWDELCDRDNFLKATEAVELGLIDEVRTSAKLQALMDAAGS